MTAIAVLTTFTSFVDAQTTDSASTNNPFAPNPRSRTVQSTDPLVVPNVVFERSTTRQADKFVSSNINFTKESVETAALRNIGSAAVGKYTVGPSDILDIYFKGQQLTHRYYTVSEDGTIDFALAGGKIFVASKTVLEIEQELKKGTALIGNTAISIRVKERSSHSIEVTGAVSTPGVIQLQRDAVPLYVLNASVVPDKSAKVLKLARTENGVFVERMFEIQKDSETLILPGDKLEYLIDASYAVTGYFYIAGRASIIGKQDLTPNSTLSSVVASASLQKDAAKRIRLRTRTTDGTLRDLEVDARSIKNGKVADVQITQGSIIEFVD